MRIPHSARIAIAAFGMAAGMAACDSASEEAATGTAGKRVISPQASKLAANMVAAVSADSQKSAVDVKFELVQRPEVGKPTDISLVLIPVSRLERLHARFAAADGVDVVKGEQTEQFARPVVGAAITHTLTILPKRDGIFAVQAVVLMDSDSESVSRTFCIPLIAGSGIAEWSPKKGAAKGDDAG